MFNYPIIKFLNYQILLLAVLAAGLAVLLAGLRPDSFYSGDPGIKLLATRAALAHPSHPFDIALPTIDDSPTVHIEPFLFVHGDHAHAVTSPVFPLATAPFLKAFGMYGLYMLPALAFLLTVAGCGALAQALDSRRSRAGAMGVATLATPFLFYALEFWEHLPAVACATWATVWLLRRRAFSAGLLLGIGMLLRPELGWFGLAVASSAAWLQSRPPWRELGVAAAGVVAALAPYEIYVVAHFGTLVPPHLGTNSGAIAESWIGTRREIFDAWFATTGPSSFWAVAPAVVGALATLALPARDDSRRALWLIALITIVATFLSAPNTGGGQWGSRYLLAAYVPLVVLASALVEQLRAGGRAGTIALAVVVIGALWVQRSAYRELRGTKATYGRIVDFVADNTAESRAVVTDVWWLDQVAAAPLDGKQVFYTPEGSTGRDIVRRHSDHTIPVVTVVRSSDDSPDTSSWNDGTCYFEEHRERTSVRNLVLIQLRHRCPQ